MRRLQRSTHGFKGLRQLRLRCSGGQLQNYQIWRELLHPKFTSYFVATTRRWNNHHYLALDDNLKIATLVNGLRGSLQRHLLFSLRPTFYLESRERDSRELLQFDLLSRSYLRYVGRRSRLRQRKKGTRTEAKETTTAKGKGAEDNKGGKGYNYSPSSWSASSSNYYNSNYSYNKGKGGGKGKGKPTTTNNSVQCHICKKFATTYTTAVIGSDTPSQSQRLDLNHTTLTDSLHAKRSTTDLQQQRTMHLK